MTWRPDSWRNFEIRQQPDYSDRARLVSVERELAASSPLVRYAEVERMRERLVEAQAGRAFLLQGGDCAESFAAFSPDQVRATVNLLEAMAQVISRASGRAVIRVGRLAGQFAKPRTADLEWRNGLGLPAYRGDIVNGLAFDSAARRPDPYRMLRAYAQAARTLELLRGWDASVHVSHEALLLPYEEALVRTDGESGRAYASSGHLLWVGDRTRFPGSAHVEFARGIANPIGIKCGPSLDAETLLSLLERLNPGRESGRITLISRMGQDRIARRLPALIRAVRSDSQPVLWSCDPMHGNTIRAADGTKDRPMVHVLAETRAFFEIVAAEGAVGGGLHIEMTAQPVSECTGGIAARAGGSAAGHYLTQCDPRLNPEQALEVAGQVAGALTGTACAAPVSVALA